MVGGAEATTLKAFEGELAVRTGTGRASTNRELLIDFAVGAALGGIGGGISTGLERFNQKQKLLIVIHSDDLANLTPNSKAITRGLGLTPPLESSGIIDEALRRRLNLPVGGDKIKCWGW